VAGPDDWRLRVIGAVAHPLALALGDLAGMPQVEATWPFHCSEGFTVPAVRWRGVTLGALLAQANATPAARARVAGSGAYSVRLPLAEALAGEALVALHRDGRPLRADEGPARLVFAGAPCRTSVKALDRLELDSGTDADAPSAANTGPLASALRVARQGAEAAPDLERLWAELERLWPRQHAGGAQAAAAEMLAHLWQSRLGPRLPEGPLYRERLRPLATDLHALLGVRGAGERRAVWLDLVVRCAAVYTDPQMPYRYRLLAQQWAKMAAGTCFLECGEVLVPPTLDGVPPEPFWLGGAGEGA
jgi:DMSO/TMAO reductase YedYZ molybdopterin-dependent catalytic subunit